MLCPENYLRFKTEWISRSNKILEEAVEDYRD
jgi:hypothetical protein